MSASIPTAPVRPLTLPNRSQGVQLTRASTKTTPVTQTFRSLWFALLLGAICFEGLGRRYLPGVPSWAFYFFKDGVLLIGLIRFRINPEVRTIFSQFYRGFAPFLKLAMLWTLVEIINPDQASLALGILGFRAYWLWWVAPLVVASVLLDPVVRKQVVILLSAVTIVVSLLASLQFGAPIDSSINTYSTVDGAESAAIPVATTGRVRVSSTFSFITGYGDFAILVPVLLLSLGLGEKDRKARLAALMATLAAAAALPMSGSRGPFLTALALCLMVVWRAGLIFTQIGRRVIISAIAAGFISVWAFPDALQGVMDCLEGGDTEARTGEFLNILPPVAITRYIGSYSPMGIGTGMTQNYRGQFGVSDSELGPSEGEVGRYLAELGPAGYLLVWIARTGLVVVLWRASRTLKKAGRRAAAAGAAAYAILGLVGGLVFDHIFCSLFFVGYGFILQEVVHARQMLARAAAAQRGNRGGLDPMIGKGLALEPAPAQPGA